MVGPSAAVEKPAFLQGKTAGPSTSFRSPRKGERNCARDDKPGKLSLYSATLDSSEERVPESRRCVLLRSLRAVFVHHAGNSDSLRHSAQGRPSPRSEYTLWLPPSGLGACRVVAHCPDLPRQALTVVMLSEPGSPTSPVLAWRGGEAKHPYGLQGGMGRVPHSAGNRDSSLRSE